MTFLPELKRLMDAATKGAESSEKAILFIPHGISVKVIGQTFYPKLNGGKHEG